ncbi:uncharacterized protein LOC127130699 [Lathyrus oleraceus]|uniref:uncharacterized protein LOC127130699 n=1 Tax=Pisum sativum TaxID=3888 RepID=UPI0021D1AE0D|nr:uncharacterized protein LOC127130699 [Pisum sativum]
MSLTIRYVDVSSNYVSIEEPFLGFFNVNDTTGQGFFDVLQDELKILDLDIFDVRGQGYDNGSNMKEKHHGAQKKFLDINPIALYTPCACHSLNLTLCDMANSCPKAKDFFGVVQCIYTICANSTKRWEILKDFREALLEVSEKDLDSKIRSETKSLSTNELGDFDISSKTYNLKKKQFDENLNTPPIELSEEDFFRVNYFLYLVDQAIVSLNKRFEQYQRYESVFAFLFTSQKLLRDILHVVHIGPIDILRFLKDMNFFPNTLIAYRILLTIRVTVASTERNFSKLKLLKSFFQSTVLQERFNGLALIAIENDLLENIPYEDLIEEFASKNARRETSF